MGHMGGTDVVADPKADWKCLGEERSLRAPSDMVDHNIRGFGQ